MAESVEGSSQPAAVILPWKTNSVAGFRVQVEVKASGIPGAGTGRFAAQKVSKGAVVRSEPIQSVDKFIASGGTKENATVAIEIKDASDLDKLSSYYLEHDA